MDQVWGPDGDDWCCKETLQGHESTAGQPKCLLVAEGLWLNGECGICTKIVVLLYGYIKDMFGRVQHHSYP